MFSSRWISRHHPSHRLPCLVVRVLALSRVCAARLSCRAGGVPGHGSGCAWGRIGGVWVVLSVQCSARSVQC